MSPEAGQGQEGKGPESTQGRCSLVLCGSELSTGSGGGGGDTESLSEETQGSQGQEGGNMTLMMAFTTRAMSQGSLGSISEFTTVLPGLDPSACRQGSDLIY